MKSKIKTNKSDIEDGVFTIFVGHSSFVAKLVSGPYGQFFESKNEQFDGASPDSDTLPKYKCVNKTSKLY